ncbi:MAG: hypothetical protein WCT40_04935, partial [Candidatus Magasanikbacteria bacterium]
LSFLLANQTATQSTRRTNWRNTEDNMRVCLALYPNGEKSHFVDTVFKKTKLEQPLPVGSLIELSDDATYEDVDLVVKEIIFDFDYDLIRMEVHFRYPPNMTDAQLQQHIQHDWIEDYEELKGWASEE